MSKEYKKYWVSPISNTGWTGAEFHKITKIKEMVTEEFVEVIEVAALEEANKRIAELENEIENLKYEMIELQDLYYEEST